MTLGLIGLAVAPLAGRSPFQENFKFEGILPNDPVVFVNTGSSSFWAYSSPYLGGLALLDEGANSASREASFRNSVLAASLGIPPTSNSGFDFDTSPLPGGFDPTNWYLISCDPNGHPTCGPGYGQEFLVQLPGGGTPTSVTPEPATRSLLGTGLAGVLGMQFRRRKRRRA